MSTVLVISPDLRALQAAHQALIQRGHVVVFEYSGAGGLSALDTVQADVICFDRAVKTCPLRNSVIEYGLTLTTSAFQ